jgi:hypothetical protein
VGYTAVYPRDAEGYFSTATTRLMHLWPDGALQGSPELCRLRS